MIETPDRQFEAVIQFRDFAEFIVPSTALSEADLLAPNAYEMNLNSSVKDLMASLSKQRSRTSKISPNDTLHTLSEYFCEDIRTIPVVNEKNQVVRVISQFDLVNWLIENPHRLPSMGEETADDLQLISKKGILLSQYTPLITGLSFLRTSGLDEIALLDIKGSIVSVFSHKTHLKGVVCADDIKKSLSRLSPAQSINRPWLPLETTVHGLLQQMIKCKTDNIWLIDSLYDPPKPVGFFTFTNLLRHLAFGKDHHRSKVSLTMTNIVYQYSGWLKKRSPAFHQKWQTRWFVIKGNRVTYFKSRDMTESAGDFDVKGSYFDEKSETDLSFTLMVGSRPYVLQSSTEEEKQHWISMIQNCQIEN